MRNVLATKAAAAVARCGSGSGDSIVVEAGSTPNRIDTMVTSVFFLFFRCSRADGLLFCFLFCYFGAQRLREATHLVSTIAAKAADGYALFLSLSAWLCQEWDVFGGVVCSGRGLVFVVVVMLWLQLVVFIIVRRWCWQ